MLYVLYCIICRVCTVQYSIILPYNIQYKMYVQIILTLLSDGGCMYIVLDTADKSLIMVTAGGGGY